MKPGTAAAPSLLLTWMTAQSPSSHERCALWLRQVDAEFTNAEQLQPLPRLVYALLRSPLLASEWRLIRRAHPDAPAALRHLWAGLPPRDLRCAVYPTLSSFSDPDTLVRSLAAAATVAPVCLPASCCCALRMHAWRA